MPLPRNLFGQPFDQGGSIAASGKVLDQVVSKLLRRSFFTRKPPKTAGREEFGREFVREFLRHCGRSRKQDAVATATALTANSIAYAVRRHAAVTSGSGPKPAFQEMILSGGERKTARSWPCWPANSRRLACVCDSPMNLVCLRRRKRRWRLLCWRMRPGIGGHPTFLRLRAPDLGRCLARFRILKAAQRKRHADLYFVTSRN